MIVPREEYVRSRQERILRLTDERNLRENRIRHAEHATSRRLPSNRHSLYFLSPPGLFLDLNDLFDHFSKAIYIRYFTQFIYSLLDSSIDAISLFHLFNHGRYSTIFEVEAVLSQVALHSRSREEERGPSFPSFAPLGPSLTYIPSSAC